MAAQRSQIGLKSAAGTLKSAAGENFAKNDKKSYFFLWKNRFFWPFGAFGAEGAEFFFRNHPPPTRRNRETTPHRRAKIWPKNLYTPTDALRFSTIFFSLIRRINITNRFIFLHLRLVYMHKFIILYFEYTNFCIRKRNFQNIVARTGYILLRHR